MAEPFPLAPALWAATAAPQAPAPKLAEDLVTDFCVIGAGYAGLSTALHIAKAGGHVVVLEAREPGWGVLIHRDVDERHQGIAEHFGVQPGVVTGNEAGFFQRPHASQTGGWRKTDGVRQILIADAPVLLQRLKNQPVKTVSIHEKISGRSCLALFCLI